MPESSQRLPNIFIASSSEALPVARAVKQNFDREADVDIWTENIFKANRGYLDTLLNRASYHDFVIAVFTPDEEAVIRDRPVKVTRDNVIFEFGLVNPLPPRLRKFPSELLPLPHRPT
jgi:predicted nucleotide-binding protein